MKKILLLLVLGIVSVSRSASRSPQEQERKIALRELFEARELAAEVFDHLLLRSAVPDWVLEKLKTKGLPSLFRLQAAIGAQYNVIFDFTDGISSLPVVWNNMQEVVARHNTLVHDACQYGRIHKEYYRNPINGEQRIVLVSDKKRHYSI